MVYLKNFQMCGMMWFGFKGNMSPKYVGPYPIVGVVGYIACCVELPVSSARVHNMFHVMILMKCILYPNKVFIPPMLEIANDITYIL